MNIIEDPERMKKGASLTIPQRIGNVVKSGPGPAVNWAGVIIGFIGTAWGIGTTVLSSEAALNPLQLLVLFLCVIASYVLFVGFLVSAFTRANGALVEAIDDVRRDIELIKNEQASGALVLELAHSLNDEIAEYRAPLSKQDMLRFVGSACRQMARTFSDALGVECRVCVKQVQDGGTTRPRVRAIERSDRRVGPSEIELHYIDTNTDFDELYSKGKKYWFSNDVDKEPGYENSSPNRKYRSTIVWPVITRAKGGISVGGEEMFSPVAAFLCIDSITADAFTRDIHVPLGWAVADALARAFESTDGTPVR